MAKPSIDPSYKDVVAPSMWQWFKAFYRGEIYYGTLSIFNASSNVRDDKPRAGAKEQD